MSFIHLARELAASAPHRWALAFLGHVPGAPPITQTLHLLSIASIVGSTIFIDLRILGLALRSQDLGAMTRRLMPWTWWALPVLFVSGSVFVLARPMRYFVNPVFGWKFVFLGLALLVTLYFHWSSTRAADYWSATPARRLQAKTIAAVSLLLWLGVIFAGRWIAYADYLYPELGN
jgi:hypothetical protein